MPSKPHFRFSPDPETSMGLVQHEGGPCGVLAAVQVMPCFLNIAHCYFRMYIVFVAFRFYNCQIYIVEIQGYWFMKQFC